MIGIAQRRNVLSLLRMCLSASIHGVLAGSFSEFEIIGFRFCTVMVKPLLVRLLSANTEYKEGMRIRMMSVMMRIMEEV
jgi:hypothetical protein